MPCSRIIPGEAALLGNVVERLQDQNFPIWFQRIEDDPQSAAHDTRPDEDDVGGPFSLPA